MATEENEQVSSQYGEKDKQSLNLLAPIYGTTAWLVVRNYAFEIFVPSLCSADTSWDLSTTHLTVLTFTYITSKRLSKHPISVGQR